MPHFIYEAISNKKAKLTQKENISAEYLILGNSILSKQFELRLDFPVNRKYVRIGNDCFLNCSIIFESSSGEVVIGDRVFIGKSQIISKSRIEFGNDIFVAWDCIFYDHDSHSLDYRDRQMDIKQQLHDYRAGLYFTHNKNWGTVNSKPIKICDNVWIGMKCIILKGVTIGEGAIVGAGSVVTSDVEPFTVMAGNPAKIIKRLK